ncbi:unannotated protein [freshwater metagenome]|uniref:Unannotated protein n=1 Tax=freshwater metagenome TaxID=449393 RepID=A0A6J7CUF6_9ZZZZ
MRRHYKFNTYSYLWLLYVSPKKISLHAFTETRCSAAGEPAAKRLEGCRAGRTRIYRWRRLFRAPTILMTIPTRMTT